MKERHRILRHCSLLLVGFLSILLLWHLLRILKPFSAPAISTLPPYVTHSQFYNYSHPLHKLAPNDYNILVNYSFEFDILSLGCSDETFLLVLVHSAPENGAKRSVIRSTWGNKRDGVRFFFVMGRPSSSTRVFDEVEKENLEFRDIVMGSFTDVYRNLTLKHITTLKYAVYHCPQAKYLLKTDDDVLVNMPLLERFLSVDLSPYGTSNLLFCKVSKSASVLRTYRSKWRVAFEEYPYRTYPPYCPGWVILYSSDVVFKLYRSAQNSSEIFWIDDVYITGILAAKNNITHTEAGSTIISFKDQKHLIDDGVFPKKPFLFGRHDLKEGEIRTLWMAVLNQSVPHSLWMDRELVS